MRELKNCPFCGGEVEIKQEKMYGYWIGCPSCSIETSYMNKADAIAAWNTRPASPRFTEAEREAMERVTDKAECLNLDGCDGCSHWNYVGSCKHFISEEELLCAIAAVRAMLTDAEIADKEG